MASEISIHGIPLTLLVITLVTFTITYVWSVGQGHVSAVFPSISDTGAFPPESNLFGEMANMAAILVALTIYLRYILLRDFAYVDRLPSFQTLIFTNLVLGLTVALGVSLVGNYQTVTIAPLHYIGAYILFGLGAVYIVIDVVLSYNTALFPKQSQTINHFRVFLVVLVLSALILMIVTNIAASQNRVDGLNNPQWRLIWRPQDGGYTAHVISNVSEWIIGIAELGYFATFMVEFRKFRLPLPQLRPVDPTTTLRHSSSMSTSDTAAAMGGSDRTVNTETEPLLKSRSKQFLYIGTGDI